MGQKKRKTFFHPVWKDYVAFNARELTGLRILLVLMVLQCGLLYYFNFSTSEVVHLPADPQIVAAEKYLADQQEKKIHLSDNYRNQQKYKAKEQVIRFFKFNPNLISAEQWQELGLSEKQAAVIRRFLDKGGKFRIKSDVAKMYCIRPQEYQRLLPWIELPDSVVYEKKFSSPDFATRKALIIDINTADSADFEKWRGVGPVMASRIVRYRERLGGFIAQEQLKEVYGFSDSLYQTLLSTMTLTDTVAIKKIAIKSITFDELRKHPYVDYKLARMIINYRDQHPHMNIPTDLRALPLVSDEIFRKLAPYLVAD